MKVLLIGGSGQIGLELQTLLKDKNIDCYAPGHTELDLEKPEHIDTRIKCYQPDMVINVSSFNDPVKAENEPSRCFRINRDAIAELADCCQREGCGLIHISTYRVFDGLKEGSYTEKDTPNPTGVLGTSRWQAEQQIRQRCDRHIILRLSWVISEHRNNLLPYLLEQIISTKELAVVSDQLGCPTPADDAARVITAIVQQLDCGADAWGTYHYAGSEEVSENSFAEIVIAEASQYQSLRVRKLRMVKVSEREGIQPPANASLASNKILSTFGVHTRSWRNALAKMVKNYYQNQ